MSGTKYVVQKMAFDASRPYAVIATFRSFNKVVDRYADEVSAKRRARDMNKRMVDFPVDRRLESTYLTLKDTE